MQYENGKRTNIFCDPCEPRLSAEVRANASWGLGDLFPDEILDPEFSRKTKPLNPSLKLKMKHLLKPMVLKNGTFPLTQLEIIKKNIDIEEDSLTKMTKHEYSLKNISDKSHGAYFLGEMEPVTSFCNEKVHSTYFWFPHSNTLVIWENNRYLWLPACPCSWQRDTIIIKKINIVDGSEKAFRRKYKVIKVEKEDVLNVRSEPFFKAELIEQLASDSKGILYNGKIKLYKKSIWWYIETPSGRKGWANSDYLAPE
jgi:hypothetical protein